MTQRNPMNERYNSAKPEGKTRKSAASAKPSSRAAATTYVPGPKTKKQKREEQRERERKEEEKMREKMGDDYTAPSAEYRFWRRAWWVLLIAGIAFTALSFLFSNYEATQALSIIALVVAYAAIIGALYVDWSKIRKMRNGKKRQFKSNSKAARKVQKQRHAELVAARHEGGEAYAEAVKKNEEANNASQGIISIDTIKDVFVKKDKSEASDGGSDKAKGDKPQAKKAKKASKKGADETEEVA